MKNEMYNNDFGWHPLASMYSWFLKQEKLRNWIVKLTKYSEKTYLIIAVVFLLLFSFFWFELRPLHIKKECAKGGILVYTKCMRNAGLVDVVDSVSW